MSLQCSVVKHASLSANVPIVRSTPGTREENAGLSATVEWRIVKLFNTNIED